MDGNKIMNELEKIYNMAFYDGQQNNLKARTSTIQQSLKNIENIAAEDAHIVVEDYHSEIYEQLEERYARQVDKELEEQEGMKFDTDKNRLDLVPPSLVLGIGEVLTYGAKKYAPENWREVDDGITRYKSALLRHLYAYLDGEWLDSESGLPHLWHVGCNLAFLIEIERAEE